MTTFIYHAEEDVLNNFYKVRLHDEKAYAKTLKKVEQIKTAMGDKYCLHPKNFVEKQSNA